MAMTNSKTLQQDYNATRKRQTNLSGRFATLNSVAGLPKAVTTNAKGFTVKKTAAGTYVLTFSDWPVDYLTFHPSLQLPAASLPTRARAVIGPISVANKTVTVYTLDDTGALADPADDANSQVFIASEHTDSPDAT